MLFDKIGIDPGYVIIVTFCGLVAMVILYVVLRKKFHRFETNYRAFMKGSDGETLEDAILAKFMEFDEIKDIVDKNSRSIDKLINDLTFTYQKFSILKYDAFMEMGGKLSFSLCLLSDNNDGFILTSVHSSNGGCYTYIKEIIKGEAFSVLSEEEKKVLQQAKTRKSCLDD